MDDKLKTANTFSMASDIRISKLPASIVWGYASGAIGYNLLLGVINNFLMYYFTDVLLITAAAGGTIMLIARLWDGINDPIMGNIVDQNNTRMGKYRPFLLWGAIPLGIFSILTFTAPDLSTSGKVLYGGAMYILFGMAYTFCNIPYMAMQATISFNLTERTRLISIKSMVAMFALIAGLGVFKPIVDLFPSEKSGFSLAISIMVIIAIISILISFRATKKYATFERSDHEKKEKFKDKIKVITQNKPALIIMTMLFVSSIMQTIIISSAIYYATYNLERPDLVSILMMLSIFMVPAMLLVPSLQKRMGKIPLFILGLGITGLASLAIFFIPYNQIGLILFFAALKAFGLGFTSVLIWALVADCVDFGALITGFRSSGIVFSSTTFLQKAGMAVGGWMLGMVLTIAGYIPNQTQSPEALKGILLLVSVIPTVLQIISIIIMKFYPLNEAKMDEVQKKLTEKGIQ